MQKNSIYLIIAICLGFLGLAIGLYQAIRASAKNHQPAAKAALSLAKGDLSKAPAKNDGCFRLLILGDSIAKGTGDEKNKGFPGYLPDYLKTSTAKEILVTDEGIDGLESSGLLEHLLSRKLDETVAGADMILISIGANDLRRTISLDDLVKEDIYNQRQKAYLDNLKETIKYLRTANPRTLIVFLGLYNPFEKISGQLDTRLLSEWNYNSELLIEEDVHALFLPTYDLMKYNLGEYLADDGLHPNSAGYQALSYRISKSVESISK